jgi:CRISPR-associated protein Csy2
MSQYILIRRLKVQNANAIAGFTWGFPAITHFLGFTHNIERRLHRLTDFSSISLSGCAVVAHEQHVHTYGQYDAEFTQSRNPPYLPSHGKDSTPPVIEEGKMNMTVSLLIGCDGTIGNKKDTLREHLEKICLTQRLAGGSILNETIEIEFFSDDDANLRPITRKLLPGFILLDRSAYLKEHYQTLCQTNPKAELLDAWLDFAALKKAARPKSDLITRHLVALSKDSPEDVGKKALLEAWQGHTTKPYAKETILQDLKDYFAAIDLNQSLKQQWQDYMNPNEATDADWEYVAKPNPGYLVPIMTGYKAISPVYDAGQVKNTRDVETPVCFVEAAHSVGEWKGVHRIKTMKDLAATLWHYDYEAHWYLCKQRTEAATDLPQTTTEDATDSVYDFY